MKVEVICQKMVCYPHISHSATVRSATLLGFSKLIRLMGWESQALGTVVSYVPYNGAEYNCLTLAETAFYSEACNRSKQAAALLY